MQMPNASPQGIAGLMQKPPGQVPGQQPGQQPPMPSPNKASPMAGLGSVDDRVSAYQGNTKPLEQRYAMSQDLLDLLALQKIKSQKDAAARQMQLQMAQQQAQNGQSSMTVAQQREQEVNALTKNELAQQRGDTAQKQTSDQQAMMQKLMGGIAGAPGANAAAQPMAMAAGGIVGYAVGGEILDQARERRKAAQQKVYSYGLNQRRQDPEGFQAAQAALQAAQEALQAAEKGYEGEMSAVGVSRPAFSSRDVGAARGAMQDASMPEALATAPISATVSEARATAVPPVDVVAAPPAPPRPPRPPVAPKPPGLPTAPPGPAPGASANMVNPMTGGLGSTPAAAAAGVGGAPPAAAAGAGGAPPAAGNFGDRVKQASINAAEIDDVKRGRDEEKRVEGRTALSPEQRRVYEEGIGGLQKMYQEQYDPERQRQEGLKRFLIGAGGRRYGEFGAGAAASMDYDTGQRAAKLKEFGGIQDARTGLIGLDRGAVKSGLDAGAAARKEAGELKRQGLASSSNIYGTDVKGFTDLYSTDATTQRTTLDREIEKLKVGVTSEANRIQRESLGMDKARTFLGLTQSKLENTIKDLDKAFSAGPVGLLMMGDPTKLKPEEKNRLDIAVAEHEKNKARVRAEMKPILESAMQKLGIATGSAASPAQEAALDKYAPKAK